MHNHSLDLVPVLIDQVIPNCIFLLAMAYACLLNLSCSVGRLNTSS